MTITLFFNAKHLVSVEIFLEKKGQQISVPECLSSICVMQQQKIPHTGNTRPSCTCVIQEYRYYTMSLSQYHGCCQYHKSMSIPWVFANTMSPCLYHESMSIPRVHVNTISPCLYLESSIPWVQVFTMSPSTGWFFLTGAPLNFLSTRSHVNWLGISLSARDCNGICT